VLKILFHGFVGRKHFRESFRECNCGFRAVKLRRSKKSLSRSFRNGVLPVGFRAAFAELSRSGIFAFASMKLISLSPSLRRTFGMAEQTQLGVHVLRRFSLTSPVSSSVQRHLVSTCFKHVNFDHFFCQWQTQLHQLSNRSDAAPSVPHLVAKGRIFVFTQ
jgi:hypothetical protein